MLKKILIFIILVSLISLQVYSDTKKKKSQLYIKGNKSGYLLLNDLISPFESYNPDTPSKNWKNNVLKSLKSMLNSAKKAKSSNEVDAKFFERYKRLIYVVELSFLKQSQKNTSVLDTIILDQIKEFDTSRKKSNQNNKDEGINSIAGAIAEEILSLKRYLDFIYNVKNILLLERPDLPKVVKTVTPKLPLGTSKAMISGRKVVLNVSVDGKGNVVKAGIVSSKYPKLNRCMVDAMKLFKFEPYILNGIARSVRFNISMSFN